MNYQELKRFWKGKRVLTTGGSGYKGSWLLLILEEMGADITDISLDPPSKPHMHELVKYNGLKENRLDIRDYEKLSKIVNDTSPDIVFHLAAKPVLLESYNEPIETYQTNVMGTLNLLDAVLREGSAKALVNITTDKVYQNRNKMLAYKEGDKLGGYDPYSNSKACSEMVTCAYRDSFYTKAGIGLSTARSGNVISGGDWQRHRLIPNLVRIINKDVEDSYFYRNKKMLIRRDSVRPWSYVMDVLLGYMILAQKTYEQPDKFSGAYNFSSQYNSIRTVGEIADKLLEYYGVNAKDYVSSFDKQHEDKWHEDRIIILDSIKARVTLGWNSYVEFDNMIKKTANWYKAYYKHEDMNAYSKKEIEEYMRKLSG